MAKAKKDGGIVETIKTVVYALLIAGVFRTLFFQPFWIPSESMKDTLLIGDFLFVNKMAYGYSKHSCPFSMCVFIPGRIFASQPERGDIVVFKHPVTGEDFIKRLIGLPGDTIQMRRGEARRTKHFYGARRRAARGCLKRKRGLRRQPATNLPPTICAASSGTRKFMRSSPGFRARARPGKRSPPI